LIEEGGKMGYSKTSTGKSNAKLAPKSAFNDLFILTFIIITMFLMAIFCF
jgi:hypothetical protein